MACGTWYVVNGTGYMVQCGHLSGSADLPICCTLMWSYVMWAWYRLHVMWRMVHDFLPIQNCSVASEDLAMAETRVTLAAPPLHWWLRLVQCLGIRWFSVTVVLKLRPSEVFIQFPAETQESMIRSARQRAKQKAKADGVVSWFIIVKTFRQGHDLRWNGVYGAHRDPACRPGKNRFIPCI